VIISAKNVGQDLLAKDKRQSIFLTTEQSDQQRRRKQQVQC